jgi:hypothetical protein
MYIDTYLAANQIIKIPHPTFLPDLTSSGFYLFGKLKVVLKGSSFKDEDKFLRDVIRF